MVAWLACDVIQWLLKTSLWNSQVRFACEGDFDGISAGGSGCIVRSKRERWKLFGTWQKNS
jgi:hypothetical protein